MTGKDIREIRAALGLTQTELAHALGFEGLNARSTINRAEHDKVSLSGSASLALTYLAQGALDETMASVIPEWVMGGAHDGAGPELLIHLRRPRFIGLVTDGAITPDLDQIAGPTGEVITVAMWIDDPTARPGFDVPALLRRASAALEVYTQDSFDV